MYSRNNSAIEVKVSPTKLINVSSDGMKSSTTLPIDQNLTNYAIKKFKFMTMTRLSIKVIVISKMYKI